MNKHKANRRRQERRPFQGKLLITWHSRGSVMSAPVNCLDVSDNGFRIACPEQIDVREVVYVKSPKHDPLGTASVRFCRFAGMRYQLGLEFRAPQDLAPEHRQRYLGSPAPVRAAC
jgi:hypothetical protein